MSWGRPADAAGTGTGSQRGGPTSTISRPGWVSGGRSERCGRSGHSTQRRAHAAVVHCAALGQHRRDHGVKSREGWDQPEKRVSGCEHRVHHAEGWAPRPRTAFTPVSPKRTGQDHVRFGESFTRPAEVDALMGTRRRAHQDLGWKAQTTALDLARLTVDAPRGDRALPHVLGGCSWASVTVRPSAESTC